jgi:hypothetical protein
MAFRKSTQRQQKALGHLLAEFTGDVITITGPHPESGLMAFNYLAKDRFGGFYVDRRGGIVTAHEAGHPDPAEFRPAGVRISG